MWWNNLANTAAKRKEYTYKEVLGARDVYTKERCRKVYKEEKRKVKRFIYQSKKEVNEHFRRKMNQDVKENRKLFWKEVSKENGGKVKISERIKDENDWLALEKPEVRMIWKEYYEDLYNIDTQE